MKRTPLVRKRPWRPWRRPEEDKMPDGLWDYVVARDGDCIAKLYDPAHACQGQTTVDHVPRRNENAMGKRAPSTKWTLVRLCWGANVLGWASANREMERIHLALVEPE